MYEHSYQMDYGAAASSYVDAFVRNIHWETVALRMEKAAQIRPICLAGGLR
jgi:superoxide dismutase, Fe-Mn family